MDKRENNSGDQGKLDVDIIQMLKEPNRRNSEGWRFRYGVDGFLRRSDKQKETIIRTIGEHGQQRRFQSDDEALEWVIEQARKGSPYHQAAIKYVTIAQIFPDKTIKSFGEHT